MSKGAKNVELSTVIFTNKILGAILKKMLKKWTFGMKIQIVDKSK